MSQSVEFTGRKSVLVYVALLILLLGLIALLITVFAPPSEALSKGQGGGGLYASIMQWVTGHLPARSPVSHSGT